VKLELSAYS